MKRSKVAKELARRYERIDKRIEEREKKCAERMGTKKAPKKNG